MRGGEGTQALPIRLVRASAGDEVLQSGLYCTESAGITKWAVRY